MSALAVLARIEWLKIRRSRAFWVTVGAFAAVMTSFAFGNVRMAARPGSQYALPDAWGTIIEPAANMGPFFLGILMILLFASEFRWKTSRQNVIDGLSKTRFGVAKLLVLAWLVGVFFVLAASVGVASALISPDPSQWPWVRATDAGYMLGFAAALVLVGSAGFMIAALVRSSGPGIGLLFIYLMMEQVIAGLVGGASRAAGAVLEFLPASVFQMLAEELVYYPELLALRNAELVQANRQPLSFPDPEVLLLAAAGYGAIFLALAFVTLRRRDL